MMKPPAKNEANTSTDSSIRQTSIKDLFQRKPKDPQCPICTMPIPLREMNTHIDKFCPGAKGLFPDDDTDLDEGNDPLAVTPKKELPLPIESCSKNANKSPLSSSPTSSKGDPLHVTPKKQSSLSIQSSLKNGEKSPARTKPSSSKGPRQKLRVAEFARCTSPPLEHLDSPKQPPSPSQRVRLSPSISNHPKRFGGLEGLSPKGVTIVPASPRSAFKSPSRSLSRRTGSASPSPKRVRKNLFQGNAVAASPQKNDMTRYVVPYYLANFNHILQMVMAHPDDVALFNEEELKIVQNFEDLSLDGKKLYVRIFGRKFAWITRDNLRYDEEIPDIDEALEQMCNAKLLVTG